MVQSKSGSVCAIPPLAVELPGIQLLKEAELALDGCLYFPSCIYEQLTWVPLFLLLISKHLQRFLGEGGVMLFHDMVPFSLGLLLFLHLSLCLSLLASCPLLSFPLSW